MVFALHDTPSRSAIVFLLIWRVAPLTSSISIGASDCAWICFKMVTPPAPVNNKTCLMPPIVADLHWMSEFGVVVIETIDGDFDWLERWHGCSCRSPKTSTWCCSDTVILCIKISPPSFTSRTSHYELRPGHCFGDDW
jgi:hypothetical protein